MVNPLISVIMPVYNAEGFLKYSIESILKQTYENFQFLIFDDGSSDRSKKIIENYAKKDARIKPFHSKINRGIVYNLNKGIKLSNTKYIARMDADDISHPERFEVLIDLMEKDKNIIVGGSFRSLLDINGKEYSNPFPMYVNDLDLKVQLLNDSCFTHSSVMIRKDVLSKTGIYYDNVAPCEDYDLWVKLSKYGRFENIPKNLLMYRMHESQSTSENKCKGRYKESCRHLALKNLIKYELDKEEELLWNNLFLQTFCLEKNEIRNTSKLINKIYNKFHLQYGKNIQFENFIRTRWFYICTMSSHLGFWICLHYFTTGKIYFNIALLVKFILKSIKNEFKLKKRA